MITGGKRQQAVSKNKAKVNQCRSMPGKTGGGGGGAQSNFPTGDHENIFNLILI